MIKLIKNLFFPQRPPIAEVNANSLQHAHFQLEEHMQAAEHHDAMIGMYTKRIARLSAKSESA